MCVGCQKVLCFKLHGALCIFSRTLCAKPQFCVSCASVGVHPYTGLHSGGGTTGSSWQDLACVVLELYPVWQIHELNQFTCIIARGCSDHRDARGFALVPWVCSHTSHFCGAAGRRVGAHGLLLCVMLHADARRRHLSPSTGRLVGLALTGLQTLQSVSVSHVPR